ncbi:MAG: CDP-glucose 4,6-dehydratase, partial [Hyphomicrobiales bacterium]|nr:CDP-glucose 4,6-dehydratase [Hyphomicrobiales bacterium]
MASSDISPDFWRGKRIFLTGHTGFKGGWLALWLHALGAEVHGYALEPPDGPNLFTASRLNDCLATHTLGDIRDSACLGQAMAAARPEILFHMAAQSLVRLSYSEPVETVATNVLGTATVLNEARKINSLRTIINVTSDKCYENAGDGRAFRESDPMGGHDPYSASKGAAELIASSFRRSFFAGGDCKLASVRAGNVIGGGDWAADRLVPDFFRALSAGTPLVIRSPNATRPWQHVLEPL